jgi:hypothetical protein
MSVTLNEGSSFFAYGYVADPIDTYPSSWFPRLIIGFESRGLSAKTGFISPQEAREIAAELLLAADKAEGK